MKNIFIILSTFTLPFASMASPSCDSSLFSGFYDSTAPIEDIFLNEENQPSADLLTAPGLSFYSFKLSPINHSELRISFAIATEEGKKFMEFDVEFKEELTQQLELLNQNIVTIQKNGTRCQALIQGTVFANYDANAQVWFTTEREEMESNSPLMVGEIFRKLEIPSDDQDPFET